jgi:hypothetical protein
VVLARGVEHPNALSLNLAFAGLVRFLRRDDALGALGPERKLTEGCIAVGKGTRPDRLRTRRTLSEVAESDGLLVVAESA